MAPEVNFNDTRMVMDDLTAVFADVADHQKVATINETFEDVLVMCGTKEKQIQEIITGLRSSIAEAEAHLKDPQPTEAHKKRMAQLQKDLQEHKENVHRLNEKCITLESLEQHLEDEAKQLSVSRQELETTATESMPKMKHELSLFAHISKVKWHYESLNQVSGTLSDPGALNTRNFHLDPSQLTQYEVVNKMWDLIG